MKRLLLSLFVLFSYSPGVLGNVCRKIIADFPHPPVIQEVLTPANEVREGTTGFIHYLDHVLDEKRIGAAELHVLIDGLEAEVPVITNPIPSSLKNTKTWAQMAHQAFDEYLTMSHIEHDKVLAWAKEKVGHLTVIEKERSETKKETRKIHYQKIEFFPLPAGQFNKARVIFRDKKEMVTLTRPIEMMSTLVTQYHWVKFLKENPSHFKEGEDSTELIIDDQPIVLQPDHPVENVTWFSAIEFANFYSRLHGLTPAYDTSGLKVERGRAESGDLIYEGKVKINSPDGTIYSAEGYRLPTSAEWEYVVRNLGEPTDKNKPYFGGEDESFTDYGWMKENSSRRTQRVAELKPFIINGHPFYDFYGNVRELVNDFYQTRPPFEAVDPVGPENGNYEREHKNGRISKGSFGYASRGAGYNKSANDISILRSNNQSKYFPDKVTGFRLVRTLKKEAQ